MNTVVSVIMGSDSDLKVMSEACKVLEMYKIEFETTIVSAHRTPDLLFEYAKSLHSRGIKIVIAGAGGAAHLPGMVASLTSSVVIGVPIAQINLSGMDALLSIVQMPKSVPVACVSIDGATNAGHLAARILGVFDSKIQDKVITESVKNRNSVMQKAARMKECGWDSYIT